MFNRKLFKKAAAIMLVIAMLPVMAACTSAAPPEKTVSNFFEALKKADIDTASKYLSTGSDNLTFTDKQQDKIVRTMLGKVDYKVISVDKDKDNNKALVKVEVTSPDLVNIMAETLKELLAKMLTTALADNKDKTSEHEKLVEESFEKCLNDPDAKVVKNQVDIMLTFDKEKNSWLIETDDMLVNAITGNAAEAFKNMSESK